MVDKQEWQRRNDEIENAVKVGRLTVRQGLAVASMLAYDVGYAAAAGWDWPTESVVEEIADAPLRRG